MAEQVVSMDPQEWQQVLAVMCNAQGPGITWAITNPLIMKLGQQLQAQTPAAGVGPSPYANQSLPAPGNGLDPEPGEINPRRVPRAQ